jgi:adenylate cyclase
MAMSSLTFWKRAGWRGALLGLACALAAWLLTRAPLADALEEWLQDGCFAFRGPRPTATRVFLVSLDDTSLDKLGKPLMYTSPELAEVVAFLHRHGAAAVGLDVLVPEQLSGLPAVQEGQPGDATRLGAAIQEAGNVVLPEWQLQDQRLRPLLQWQARALDEPQATDFGFVNLTDDSDFFLRRQQLYARAGDEAHMHFALALYARARGLAVKWADGSLRVGGESVPLDDEQKLRINFVGPPGSFPVVPFRDALAAARGRRPFLQDPRGAIVIVGFTASSQQDFHTTPFANNYWRPLRAGDSFGPMAGSEVHANIVATLGDAAYLRALPWVPSLGLLLLTGALLGTSFTRLSLPWGFGLALAHHWAWKAAALASFCWLGLRLEIVSMLLLGVLAYGVAFLWRWWTLRRMLGVVKSEAVARMLENDSGCLDRRGQECVATVLFADLRDFTSFAEAHSAREVVALLNAYFDAVVPVIEAHGGTLNQYMGDGVMVLFGVPLPQPDHALRAVRTAVDMVRRIHELAERWRQLGFAGLRIGVGVHTGRLVAAAVGSARRLDYTAIGDTVNAAARIEAQNKAFGTEVLISGETYRQLPASEREVLGCRPEPRQAEVKGRKQVLYLHEVDAHAVGTAPAAG